MLRSLIDLARRPAAAAALVLLALAPAAAVAQFEDGFGIEGLDEREGEFEDREGREIEGYGEFGLGEEEDEEGLFGEEGEIEEDD